jgi:glutamate:GABA antiporter
MGTDAAVVQQWAAVTQTAPTLKRELGLRDLTLFAISCIVSTRWIPIAAHAGSGSIMLWLLSAVFFVVPLTVAVAALVVKYPRTGGLYLWAREDFGPWNGFLCFWAYWIGIAFLFPTAALLYTKVGFSLLGPTYAHLGNNRFILLGATVALIWIGLGSNLFGLKVGKWTENLGALATWAVGLLLVAVAWMVWTRRGSATPIHIVPRWSWGTVSFWAAIVFATGGMEGPGMMAGEMHDPERTMRRAGWIASASVTAFYVSATMALLVVLPAEKISELNGFAEVGESAGRLLGAAWLSPLIALLVVISGAGLVGGIGTATSRLPFAAGVDGLLPKAFSRVHPRWGTPYVATLALGFVATFLLVVYQLGDSMRVAYDELVSLMVITGFIPYLYIFGCAWKAGKRLSAASGGAITALTLVCSVVPPSEITDRWLYEGKLAAGTLAVVISAWLVYRRNRQGYLARTIESSRDSII